MIDQSLHEVYLGLGSNLGDKQNNIHLALEKINERIGNIITCSAFLITEPVGFHSHNLFVNAVCKLGTKLTPLEVLEYTQAIEREMGRYSKSYNQIYSDRIIDIDILLYDDEVFDSEELKLPHPHLHERNFVVIPLAEIAGEVYHPICKKTINQLKEELQA